MSGICFKIPGSEGLAMEERVSGVGDRHVYYPDLPTLKQKLQRDYYTG